jgi:hypothetical protein
MNLIERARQLKTAVRDAIEDEALSLNDTLEVIWILTKILQELAGETERIAYRNCVEQATDTQ